MVSDFEIVRRKLMKLNITNGAHLSEDSIPVVETIFTSLEVLLKSSGSEFDMIVLTFSNSRVDTAEESKAIEQILDTVSIISGYSKEVIFSKSRKKPLPFLRYLSYEGVHKGLGMGVTATGKYFGKDHRTIIGAMDSIEELKVMVDEESKRMLGWRTALRKELHKQFGYWYE